MIHIQFTTSIISNCHLRMELDVSRRSLSSAPPRDGTRKRALCLPPPSKTRSYGANIFLFLLFLFLKLPNDKKLSTKTY
jgi:hypothetical protein